MPLKGLGILIQSYADLLPAYPDLELVVIGKGFDAAEIRKALSAAEVERVS